MRSGTVRGVVCEGWDCEEWYVRAGTVRGVVCEGCGM